MSAEEHTLQDAATPRGRKRQSRRHRKKAREAANQSPKYDLKYKSVAKPQTASTPTAEHAQQGKPSSKAKSRLRGFRHREARRTARELAKQRRSADAEHPAASDHEGSDDDSSDVDWSEWEKAGFFIPDSYKSASRRETEAPNSQSRADTPMDIADDDVSIEVSGEDEHTRQQSEQQIIDEAFEFAVEFLSKRQPNTMTSNARRKTLSPDETSETWLSPADKVFGIYELCEQVMLHLRQDEVMRARGINKNVRATVHTSKLLRKALFLEPASDAVQSFWVHSEETESIAHIDRADIASHATLPNNFEELLFPRALNPYLIGRSPLPGIHCHWSHLRCEYAEMSLSIPRANGAFRAFVDGERLYPSGPLPSLTGPGHNTGFTSIRFPRFSGTEPSIIDDMLLTQPPSSSVVVTYPTRPTCGATYAVYFDCQVDNPSGVRVSDVRRAVAAHGHGKEELSGDVGLMVLDQEGRVVLPTRYHWHMAKRYKGIVCTEQVATWDMWNMKAALMGWQ